MTVGRALRCSLHVALLVAAAQWPVFGQSVVHRDTERLLQTPEAKLDVGIAALTLAREVYPQLDVAAYSKKIDLLAAQAREVIIRHGRNDPDSVIRALNSFFYKIHGLYYDPSAEAWEKRENYFLVKILDTKEGTCANMPVLYMAVAQRLGYPVYSVSIPEHQFLRYVSPSLKDANIEATGGGGYIPDERYMKESRVDARGPKNSDYLKTLSNREWLAHMIDTTSVTLSKQGKVDRAIYLLEKAVQINPKCAGCYHNLGADYLTKAKQQTTRDLAWRYWEKADAAFTKSKDLGYVMPFTKRADKRIREN
jgi:regulator of sirC expression with transglutaminase-like and TPR domain